MKRFQIKEIKISSRMTSYVKGVPVKSSTVGNTGGGITVTIGGGD